jgi:predicted FMN-binding regulatory protein PaiB
MGWLADRIQVPTWAQEELEAYGELYGKTETEVIREAAVEKAMSIREEREYANEPEANGLVQNNPRR